MTGSTSPYTATQDGTMASADDLPKRQSDAGTRVRIEEVSGTGGCRPPSRDPWCNKTRSSIELPPTGRVMWVAELGERAAAVAWQLRGPSQEQSRAPSPGGQVSEMGRRAAGPAGFGGEGQRVRAISSTSQRAITPSAGGKLTRGTRREGGHVAPGRGRDRGYARSTRWRFGPDVSGVFPERTTHLSPARVGTRRHEPAAQMAQGGTARSSRSRRVRLDTVEVTAVPSTVDQRRRRRVKCTCTHPSTPAPRRGDGGLRCERRAKARGIGHSRPGSWDGSWDELQTLGGRRGPERPSKGPGRTLGDAAAHAGSRPPEAGAQVRILPGAPLSA